MKILIVDDSRATRILICRALQSLDFPVEILQAADGQEGLNKGLELKPDLVVSDWIMPKMDGLEMFKKLKQHQPDIKLGFVTSQRTGVKQEQAMSEGAKFFFVKPLDTEKLLQIVRSYQS